MHHDTPLIATIVVGLSLAFALGAIAQRLKISPIVGYLLAGVAVGPYTPGFVADQGLANELAEIGIILLMFGVGLHFSLRDLWSVRAIAIPGAIAQITCATLLGLALALWLGWQPGAGIVLGLALSVASTVVLLRALQERRLLNTEQGRITIGWLIVEDIAMVLTIVAIPALAPLLASGANTTDLAIDDMVVTLLVTLLKVAAFIAVMMLVGRKLIPALLHYIAHTGSRELFRLGVLAIALGVAFAAAKLFGVSFALGAFFAGMILSESELSQQAANESLPLRDAFAVLFFVSVGMLFDPMILIKHLDRVLAVVAVIVIGKSLAALAIVRAFGHPPRTALLIAASLAQIGEFSFILAGVGVALNILPSEGQELIVAGALISIMINPLLFKLLDIVQPEPVAGDGSHPTLPGQPHGVSYVTPHQDHAVVVGYGLVGSLVTDGLVARGERVFVIDDDEAIVTGLHARTIDAVAANAVTSLETGNMKAAHTLVVTIRNCFEAGQIVEQARRLNPDLTILARAQSDAEVTYLEERGANAVIQGSRETAAAILAKLGDPPASGST